MLGRLLSVFIPYTTTDGNVWYKARVARVVFSAPHLKSSPSPAKTDFGEQTDAQPRRVS